jgi:OOP family OmpA-OmpF porin
VNSKLQRFETGVADLSKDPDVKALWFSNNNARIFFCRCVPNGVIFTAFVDRSPYLPLPSKENQMSLKKITIAALMAVSGVVVSSASFAQAKPADTGFYIGGSAGLSTIDCPGGAGSCDDEDTAYKLFGGYKFNRNLAIEGGYTPLGESSRGSVTGEATAWELLGVGSFPLGNNFSIYGKLGFYSGELEVSSPVASGKKTTTDLTYGAGVQFDFARNLGVRAEWQRYQGMEFPTTSVSSGDTDIDVLSLGVLWMF